MILDMLQGITQTSQYKASIFPGGEVQLVLSKEFCNAIGDEVSSKKFIAIHIRANSSNHIMLLSLTVQRIKRNWPDIKIFVFIHYMPYQQSDRDFSNEECFGLYTICTILNALPVDKYIVTDPHSDVTPALLKNCKANDNSLLIQYAANHIARKSTMPLCVVSPDAGAYKKIFKLCSKLHILQNVAIECANKYRAFDGSLKMHISCPDFEGRDVLVIDDICVGGRTFVELAEQIKDRNVGRLFLAVTHGVFSNGFSDLEKYYYKVFTTNSWNDMNMLRAVMSSVTNERFVHCYPLF